MSWIGLDIQSISDRSGLNRSTLDTGQSLLESGWLPARSEMVTTSAIEPPIQLDRQTG
jgi:hypothetical protein